MGVQDRDWYKDRKNLEPKNPNWQKEYARWYGKPKQRSHNQGVHWTLRLMLCSAVFLAVYVATKQLFFTGPKPAPPVVSQPARLEPAPTTTAPSAQAPRQPVIIPWTAEDERKAQSQRAEEERQRRTAAAIATANTPAAPRQAPIDPNAELARQWDQRMAQRDREIANEQVTLNAQANAAGAACAGLRQEKEAAVANLRRGGDAQWMNFWNQRFHAANDGLYRNHC